MKDRKVFEVRIDSLCERHTYVHVHCLDDLTQSP